MMGDVNILAYNINEVEFIGEFVSGEFSEITTTLFTNIVITTEMLEKIDLFLIKPRKKVIRFCGKDFNVESLIRRVKSILESPDTIWQTCVGDLYMEYDIKEIVGIRITIGRYSIIVKFIDGIYCKTIMFLSIFSE